MRADQYDRLKARSEQLIDVVIDEADTSAWPGANKKPNELTKDERGDRYWTKKNTAATLSVLVKIHSLLGILERGSNAATPPEPESGNDDLEAEIAAAEREAARIIGRIQDRSYDKRPKP